MAGKIQEEAPKMYLRVGNISWTLSIDDYKALRGMGPETVKSKFITDVIDLKLNRLKGGIVCAGCF